MPTTLSRLPEAPAGHPVACSCGKYQECVPSRDDIAAAVEPKHYRDLGSYSALHVAEKWGLNYHLGNALKYIQRAGKKPNTPEIQDLKKAAWYLARYIHLLDPENEPDPLEKK